LDGAERLRRLEAHYITMVKASRKVCHFRHEADGRLEAAIEDLRESVEDDVATPLLKRIEALEAENQKLKRLLAYIELS